MMPKPKPRKVTLNYQPHAKARAFHESTARTRIICGAQGSGKSYAVIYDILDLLLNTTKYAGKRCLVAGVNGTVVREQLYKQFLAMMTNYDKRGVNIGLREGIDYEASLNPLKIEFFNGSSINFLSLETGENLRSWSVSIIYADDLGQQDEKSWNTLCERAREEKDGHNLKIATCNSYAPSHWLYTRYFKHYWETKTQPEYTYLDTWTAWDNTFLTDRIPELEATYAYSKVETRRKLYGEWISNDGVIYTNFDRARHVFQPTTLDKIYYAPGEDEDPNKTFSFLNLANMYAGMDFGTQQGTGIVYVAKYEDRFYVTKEYFSNKPTDSTATHSAFIHRNVHCLKIYCDHAPELLNNYKAMRHTNMVLAPKGSGSIRQGIDTIQRLLAEDKLFIHHKCKRLIAELESYVWKPNSEDIPLDKDICLVDALRYVITPLAGKPNDLFAFVASTDTSVRSEPLVLAAPRAERGAVIGMRTDGTWVYEND